MRKDLLLVALMVAILTLMVIPLSQVAIDALLAVNISLSVLLFMVAIYLKHPSDFSTFPSVILLGTAFRLALSIGTTRLILTEADAGQIIETFGDFVVSGSIAVGMVIFLIITVVQFLVVTKGAERVAEVGARFALDALPGKQMSIDADIRAGTLDPEVGAQMRKRLDKDSQFFGAMDGAMKFVKGDAIAGLIIIVINLIGGVAVGMTLHGYTFGEAIAVFSLLTIGDGLVAQVPALLMSLCAGVIVTRVASDDNADLGSDISKELVSDPRVPALASAVVLGIGLIPGFPLPLFVLTATVLLFSALLLRRTHARHDAEERARLQQEEEARIAEAQDKEYSDLPISDRFEILIGSGLVQGLDLDEMKISIQQLFASLYHARGIPFAQASLRICDRIGSRDVAVELDNVPLRSVSVPNDKILLRDTAEATALLDGHLEDAPRVAWPGIDGYWIDADAQQEMTDRGLVPCPLEDSLAQLAFRLYEQNLVNLFSTQLFSELLEEMRAVDAGLMEAIEPQLPPALLYQVLRLLVEDGVPVRPLPVLIAGLHQWIHTHPGASVEMIAECLRGSMKRQMCHRIAGPSGLLGVAMMEPDLETALRSSIATANRLGEVALSNSLMLKTDFANEVLTQIRALRATEGSGTHIALVVAADLRRRLRTFLAANDLHVPVLSAHEISTDVMTCPVEFLTCPDVPA